MFRARVCPWLDPPHAVLRLCGHVIQHPGFPNAVEDELDHGSRDDWESADWKVVSLIDVLELSVRCWWALKYYNLALKHTSPVLWPW